VSGKTLIVVSASQSCSAQGLGAVIRKQMATSVARSAAPSMTDIRNAHDQGASLRRAVGPMSADQQCVCARPLVPRVLSWAYGSQGNSS
jgi:hypothetical protein